ncbi:MAG: transposase [Paraprevotella sp.]|nr:transposase [Paraprevotella sp.]
MRKIFRTSYFCWRYQHCKAVMDKAKILGIELLFLPPYSPNLNIIERL